MPVSIIAEGKLEKQQYARLCIIIYYRRPATIFFSALGLAVLAYIIFMSNVTTSARSSLLIIATIYGAYILLRPYLIYLNAGNYFTTAKNLQENIRYEFTDDRIFTTGETFKGEKGWDNFYKIVELKHFFLLYHDSRLMNIIPKSYFKSNDDVINLRNLIKNKSHLNQQMRKH